MPGANGTITEPAILNDSGRDSAAGCNGNRSGGRSRSATIATERKTAAPLETLGGIAVHGNRHVDSRALRSGNCGARARIAAGAAVAPSPPFPPSASSWTVMVLLWVELWV